MNPGPPRCQAINSSRLAILIPTVWPVETPQGGEELALCYYKNIADPEVRGWIYLKDMTEIAEIQDTIILTSVARTLYLYAQTRAQHNVWVTGLAKLCPEAFVKLGREWQQNKTLRAVPLGENRNMCRRTTTCVWSFYTMQFYDGSI